MANNPEQMLAILEDLGAEDLKNFQWHLTNSLDGDKRIPKAQLENTDRHDTVDKMVQKYGPDGAVEITLNILKKINHNQLAEVLRSRAAVPKTLPSGPKNTEDQKSAAVQETSPSEPKTRADFLKYYRHLTLDPNTATCTLRLCEMNRMVTCSEEVLPYPDRPERFDFSFQVLSKESVCGRCYWEVEWNGVMGVFISVSYKEICRKSWGKESLFGQNAQSWSLVCSKTLSHAFVHNDVKTEIPGPLSYKIGVYVDHSAGILSFYRVSDTVTLLHTVHTTFTQPLYAGIGFPVFYGTVCFCDPV